MRINSIITGLLVTGFSVYTLYNIKYTQVLTADIQNGERYLTLLDNAVPSILSEVTDEIEKETVSAPITTQVYTCKPKTACDDTTVLVLSPENVSKAYTIVHALLPKKSMDVISKVHEHLSKKYDTVTFNGLYRAVSHGTDTYDQLTQASIGHKYKSKKRRELLKKMLYVMPNGGIMIGGDTHMARKYDELWKLYISALVKKVDAVGKIPNGYLKIAYTGAARQVGLLGGKK